MLMDVCELQDARKRSTNPTICDAGDHRPIWGVGGLHVQLQPLVT